MGTRLPNASHRSSRREAGLVQRVRQSLIRRQIDTTPPFILVTCSGGRDSVVLTHLLHGLAQTGAIRIAIVHVDHGVRDDSRQAAGTVESFGRMLGVPVHTVRLQEDVVSRHPGAGVEEALRRERYKAFSDVATEIGAGAIALGHHQQDQAETVLLHLIRGAGLRGVSGMREWSTIHVPWLGEGSDSRRLELWRPLLAVPVAEIAEWHRDHELPVAEDATNTDRRFRRNAIRHDVLPRFESVLAGGVSNIARFAGIAADDDDYLEKVASGIALFGSEGVLHRGDILNLHSAIQRRVVRQWIQGGDYDGELTSDRVDAVRELARRNRSGAKAEIGSGWFVEIIKGVMTLKR